MLRRIYLPLLLSIVAHVGVVATALLAGGGRMPGGPVDFELADVRTIEVKDFPLGAPESGPRPEPRPRASPKARPRAVPAPEDDGTLKSPAGPAADEEIRRGASPQDDDGGPAPTNDLGAYGPAGSRLTVLMRLDRLRGSEFQAPVDELLQRLPDRRDLLVGTGLNLFADFDALLIATPNPLDPAVTFLAARHHLARTELRAALSRGARSTDRPLVWRTEGARLLGERRGRKGANPGAAVARADDRIVVLSDPGLAVITPPAYRALLLEAAAPPPSPNAGVAADGGVEPRPDTGPASATAAGWAQLIGRINAEEGLIPEDGVVMVKATDLLRRTGASPDGLPVLFGMEIPPEVSATIGIDGASPFVDLVGTFKTEGPAERWEARWPTLQRQLRTNPYALLTGFSALVGRASLSRAGSRVELHVSATPDEALRLLALMAQLLPSRL